MEEKKILTAEEEAESLAEQARIRREKLQKLVAEGNDPFVKVNYGVTANSAYVIEHFAELEGKEVSIAGRLMSRRVMGKASFSHIQDREGQLQIYVRRDDVGEEDYAAFKKDYDLGDIMGVKGYVFKTQTGEISVHCTHIEMLTKCLLPLPEKQHGLTNTDLRYRQRDLDLIVNPEVKDTFIKRSQILREIRAFFDNRGFLEVDTPVLSTIEIGASARPFKTHHNALDIDMYLRIETELYLKRLLVGGLERVYEVGRIFRNEGMDAYHNPEFTTVEVYQAYCDYFAMMDLVEELYTTVAKNVCGTTDIAYQGTELHLGAPWARLTMKEAVKNIRARITTAGKRTRTQGNARKSWACRLRRALRRPRDMCLLRCSTRLQRTSLFSPRLFTIIPWKIPRWQKESPTTPHLRSASNTLSAGTSTETPSRN